MEAARRRAPGVACATVLIVAIAICAPSANAQSNDYVVGAQDVLTITLWEEPELSGKFPVESDGTFSYPLLGRVKAAGFTLRALEAELKKRLKDGYFRDPQLSVTVEQYRSQRVFVVGEVRTPGTYPLTGQMTLIEAFARAGSATPDAAGYAIIVRASAAGGGETLPDGATASKVMHVNLTELQTGAMTNNVDLRDGDTIFVPRAETIYVFGQVKTPGAYPIQKNTTVLQALSVAGGVTDRGSTSRIRIVRLVDGKKVELKVGLNDLVQAGDTVIVLERFF